MKQVSTLTRRSSGSNPETQKTDFPEASIAGTFIATAVTMFGFLLLVIVFL
ncbi:hypothetical protein AB3R30_06230 [Leptolyngbyaceae cyanobacterium UHCC 1019]